LTNADRIWGLIPAAGVGLRMQTAVPKQYLPLRGRPVLLHTLERLCHYPRLSGVMVGISPGDRHWPNYAAQASRLPTFLGIYTGGATRADTVLNGLQALADRSRENDWVMVHDAVRPCVRLKDIAALAEAAGDEGALLGLPVADTVKRADSTGRVLATVAREGLWRALTPQLFRIRTLREALEQVSVAGGEITDEASAIEAVGGHPRLVAGAADNIKITLPGDLALAELFLMQQDNEST
jgi:2-C-methyl-D-erythritol 4-phosphate cytidylyltransferase